MGVSKTSCHIQIEIKMPNPCEEPPASSKAPNEDLKDMDVLCTFKIKIESQNSEYVCTKDKWPYPNQDKHPKSQSETSIFKAPNEDLKEMDVLSTFRFKIETKIWIMGISKTSDHIQIKMKMANPSQDPPASFKAPNQDLNGKDITL